MSSIFFIFLSAIKHTCAKEMFFDNDKIEHFYEVIDNDNSEKLQLLIRKDPIFKKKTKRLLFYSITKNAVQCGKLIIEHITNINESFFMENCYIQASTEYNSLEITKILLSKGADPNIITSNYCCPIVNAVKNKNIEMVQLLRQYNASIDILTYFYNVLLEYPDTSLLKDVINTMNIQELYIAKKYTKDTTILKFINDKIDIIWTSIKLRLPIEEEGIMKNIKSFIF